MASTTALANGRTMEVVASSAPDTLLVTLRYLSKAECTLRRSEGGGWALSSARQAHDACYLLYGDDGETRRRALAGILRQAAGGNCSVEVPTGPPYIYLPVGYRCQPVFEGWVQPRDGSEETKRRKKN